MLSQLSSTLFTTQIIPDNSIGLTQEYIVNSVASWPGTYLLSKTATPDPRQDGDFLVTAVSC